MGKDYTKNTCIMKSSKVFKIAAIVLGVFAIIGVGKGIKWYYWSHLTAEEKAGKITERMASRLELTSEQKEKVLSLNLEKVKVVKGKDYWRNNHDHHFKSSLVYEDWKKQMKEILSDEQEKKLKW